MFYVTDLDGGYGILAWETFDKAAEFIVETPDGRRILFVEFGDKRCKERVLSYLTRGGKPIDLSKLKEMCLVESYEFKELDERVRG